MIPPHTTSFLQHCDVGLMRPFKSTIQRTVCENYARAIYNNTDYIGIVQPTAVPDLRANLVRHMETGVHALDRDRRFEFAWKHLRSYDEVWSPLLDEARQSHAAGQLVENVWEEPATLDFQRRSTKHPRNAASHPRIFRGRSTQHSRNTCQQRASSPTVNLHVRKGINNTNVYVFFCIQRAGVAQEL